MAIKNKTSQICPLCGKEMQIIYGYNFEQLTQRAGWNMSFEPRMNICKDCSTELLASLEAWFKKRNKSNKYKKFTKENKENDE